MTRKYKGKEYAVKEWDCRKCKRFVPYCGNGHYTCRLYELGCSYNPKDEWLKEGK